MRKWTKIALVTAPIALAIACLNPQPLPPELAPDPNNGGVGGLPLFDSGTANTGPGEGGSSSDGAKEPTDASPAPNGFDATADTGPDAAMTDAGDAGASDAGDAGADDAGDAASDDAGEAGADDAGDAG